MKIVLCLAALTALYCCVNANYISPKVQVYSRMKGQFGEGNTLICNVKDFHPPDITVELLKDGEILPRVMQTDLAFKPSWQFHLTYFVPFTPAADHKYSCRVTHGSTVKNYAWGELGSADLCVEQSRYQSACDTAKMQHLEEINDYNNCKRAHIYRG